MPSEWIRDDLHEEIEEAADDSDSSFSDKVETWAEEHDADIMQVADLEDVEAAVDGVMQRYV